MKKNFANWVLQQLEQRGVSQKQLAADIHDMLEGSEEVAFETVQTRLSKLLGGKRDGVAFFRAVAKKWRWQALASVLHVDVVELDRHFLTAANSIPLILDPRLESNVVAFLVEQEAVAKSAYHCVQLAPGDAAPGALRDLARDNGPLSIVVLASEDDGQFMTGADIRWSVVMSVPRGFQLETQPQLIPVPPPAEPPKFQDDMPLRRVPDDEDGTDAKLRDEIISPARAYGEIPVLTVEETIKWLSGASLPESTYHHREIVYVEYPRLSTEDFEQTDHTTVWVEERKIFAAGPHFELLREIYSGSHEVQLSPWHIRWKQLTKPTSNPWYIETADKAELCDGCIVGSPSSESFVDAIQAWAKSRREHFLPPTEQGETTATVRRSDGPIEVRQLLRELSLRPVHAVQQKKHYDQPLAVPFLLERIAQAEWCEITPTPDPAIAHIVADMGAGNLVEVTILEFEGHESKLALSKSNGYASSMVIFGADVALLCAPFSMELMEGSYFPAREHRQEQQRRQEEEEERRREEDEDEE